MYNIPTYVTWSSALRGTAAGGGCEREEDRRESPDLACSGEMTRELVMEGKVLSRNRAEVNNMECAECNNIQSNRRTGLGVFCLSPHTTPIIWGVKKSILISVSVSSLC